MKAITMQSKIEGQFDVSLITEDSVYIIEYGADITETTSLKNALLEYKLCVEHQLNCAGFYDEQI